jgi:putative transposase
MLCGSHQRDQENVIAFLREENRVLKARLGGRRLRLDDHERRRLAELGHRLRRQLLTRVATLVTPDTISPVAPRTGGAEVDVWRRTGLQARIRSLVVRMATENPTSGYTRIQGAMKNVGHQVGRSTIARILKTAGIRPSRQRPMSWRTFLRAHWSAMVAADFFTTEV